MPAMRQHRGEPSAWAPAASFPLVPNRSSIAPEIERPTRPVFLARCAARRRLGKTADRIGAGWGLLLLDHPRHQMRLALHAQRNALLVAIDVGEQLELAGLV